jgi:hypothetical protein
MPTRQTQWERRTTGVAWRQERHLEPLEPQPSEVVGIVPDFTIGSVRNAIEPSVYYIQPQAASLVLKLDGKGIPETMRALEARWKKVSRGSPFSGRFMSQIMSDLYADIQRQTKLFAAFSAVAIVVASLGLLGLAVFTAERRTHEIGLRKVMGASRSDILRFIGWQFARPVVLANLIAWPAAWFFMRRWLDLRLSRGRRLHVFHRREACSRRSCPPHCFGHALLVARAKAGRSAEI